MNKTDANNTNIIVNKLAKAFPEEAAMLSKLIGKNNEDKDTNLKDRIDYPELRTISDKTYEKIKVNEDIMELFPDASIAVDIIVSSIACPNDLISTNLIYQGPDSFPMPDSIKKGVNDIIKAHVDEFYKLEEKLKVILKESLFTKGAYAEAFIPEASLDDIVNSATTYGYGKEDSSKNKKPRYLGSPESSYNYNFSKEDKKLYSGNVSFGVEDVSFKTVNAFGSNKSTTIDNITLKTVNLSDKGNKTNNQSNGTISLRLPDISDDFTRIKDINKLVKDIRRDTFNNIVGRQAGIESIRPDGNFEGSEEEIEAMNFINMFMKEAVDRERTIDDENNTLLVVSSKDEASRKSIGVPLILKLPVESIIPVHTPYDPSEHVGYFVLLDENGKILSVNNEEDQIDNPENVNPVVIGQADSVDFLSKAKRQQQAYGGRDRSMTNNEAIFTEIVYDMISKRLKNGAFGDLAVLNKQGNSLIYKMMFYRAIANKGTQVIFLPADIVSYYAFEYRDNGTGKSLFEKTALLYSIRATLLMTTILGYIKNSINTTNVDITLDERIQDVDNVFEQITSTIIKNREHMIPFGLIRPSDVHNAITKLGYKFNVNSPLLPEVKIDYSQQSNDFKIPDEGLDDKLMEMQLLTYGISPEMVKQGMDPDFATTVAGRNALFNNRTKLRIQRTDECNSNYCRKILKVDESLRKKIFEYLSMNMKKLSEFISRSINNKDGTNKSTKIPQGAFQLYMEKAMLAYEDGLSVSLPEIQVADGGAMMNNANTAFSNIDTIVDAVFSSDIISSDLLGETIGNKSSLIIGMIKAALKRQWVMDNNALPALSTIMEKRTIVKDSQANSINDTISDLLAVLDKFITAYEARKTLIPSSDAIKKIDEEEMSDSWGGGSGGFGDDSGGGYDDGGDGGDDGGDGGDGGDEGDDGFSFGDDGGDEGGGSDGGDEGGEGDDGQDLDEGGDDDNPTAGTDDEIKGWDSDDE